MKTATSQEPETETRCCEQKHAPSTQQFSCFSGPVTKLSLNPQPLLAAACQAPLSSMVSWRLLTFMSVESVVLSNHLILSPTFYFCFKPFPESGSFPMSRLFASGVQFIGASASACLSSEYLGLISLKMDWFGLLAVQGTLQRPRPPALGAWRLSHWTTREIPISTVLDKSKLLETTINCFHMSVEILSMINFLC